MADAFAGDGLDSDALLDGPRFDSQGTVFIQPHFRKLQGRVRKRVKANVADGMQMGIECRSMKSQNLAKPSTERDRKHGAQVMNEGPDQMPLHMIEEIGGVRLDDATILS